MKELYEKLFRYGITMIVKPERYNHTYSIEFEREAKHLTFFCTSEAVKREVFDDIIMDHLDRFIRVYEFKPMPTKPTYATWSEYYMGGNT